MIDYHAHLASLTVFDSAIASGMFEDKGLADKAASTHAAVTAQMGFAALGAVVDHLLEHAECTDDELTLLDQAAELYRRGLDYLTGIAKLRADIEQAITHPEASGSLKRFNDAATWAKTELPKINDLVADTHLFADRTEEPAYLCPHGQAADQPVPNWAWRDVILSRRSHAFCQSVANHADGSSEQVAFAFGVLASYVGNAIGSGYQNQVVGSVRRSHPMRHRIAKYAIGNWLRVAGFAPSVAALRSLLDLGDPTAPSLPPQIRTLLETALTDTYTMSGPPALPDLDEGYRKLMRHLELLDAFPRPGLPAPLDIDLAVRVLSGDGPGSGGVATKDVYRDPPPYPYETVTIPSSDDAAEKRKKACRIILFILLCVLLLLASKGTSGTSSSGPGDSSPGLSTQSSSAALIAYAASADALAMVQLLHELHLAVYAALTGALDYLKSTGLIYPDDLDLGEAGFAQFTSVLGPAGGSTFPRRAGGAPAEYRNPPVTPVEHPATLPGPYAVGAPPSVFLDVAPGVTTVASFGGALWAAHAVGEMPSQQRINLNLDGDRGFMSNCWELSGGTSINDSPVSAIELAYDAV